jgi:hypothetical protein
LVEHTTENRGVASSILALAIPGCGASPGCVIRPLACIARVAPLFLARRAPRAANDEGCALVMARAAFWRGRTAAGADARRADRPAGRAAARVAAAVPFLGCGQAPLVRVVGLCRRDVCSGCAGTTCPGTAMAAPTWQDRGGKLVELSSSGHVAGCRSRPGWRPSCGRAGTTGRATGACHGGDAEGAGSERGLSTPLRRLSKLWHLPRLLRPASSSHNTASWRAGSTPTPVSAAPLFAICRARIRHLPVL